MTTHSNLVAAAWAQTNRLRAQLRRLNSGLEWVADERHCHHDRDGGVCLACYARALLHTPVDVALTTEEDE